MQRAAGDGHGHEHGMTANDENVDVSDVDDARVDDGRLDDDRADDGRAVPGWALEYLRAWTPIVGPAPALALTRIRVTTTRAAVTFGSVMAVVYVALILSHRIEELAEASVALVLGCVTLCLGTYHRQWRVGARIVGALDSSGVPTSGVPRFRERDFELWCELQGVTLEQVRMAGSLTR